MKVFEVCIKTGISYIREFFDVAPSIQELKEQVIETMKLDPEMQNNPAYSGVLTDIENQNFVMVEHTVHQIR